MPARRPRPLTHARQLVVEGRTPVIFFEALLRSLGRTDDFQLQDFGPVQDLRTFLKSLRRLRGFTRQVTSLGIVRDAEADAANAYRSVRDALAAVKLPVPPTPGVLAPGPPRVAVFLFPDCASAGMLEDLCWQAVTGDPASPCVDEYFACLQRRGVPSPGNLAKARVQAFLSSRPRPGLLLGQAASAGYFPWAHTAFGPLTQFLQAL